MATIKTAAQSIEIAPGKDARALIQNYRSRSGQDNATAAQSLQNLQEAIDALRRSQLQTQQYLDYLIQAGAINPTPPTPPTIPIITTTDWTLTSATTLITASAPAAAGDLLFLFLIQDATGGRQITWDTNLKWATVNLAPIPDTVSCFSFVARVDPADGGALNWFCFSLPSLGNTP